MVLPDAGADDWFRRGWVDADKSAACRLAYQDGVRTGISVTIMMLTAALLTAAAVWSLA